MPKSAVDDLTDIVVLFVLKGMLGVQIVVEFFEKTEEVLKYIVFQTCDAESADKAVLASLPCFDLLFPI